MLYRAKFLVVIALAVFALACNLVSQPISDAQNLAGTAEALASAMPVETVMAFATQIPVETLQALPSAIPAVGDLINPQGTPLSEWNGIPVMPQAVAGQEVEGIYSYTANATAEEATNFYTSQIPALGWHEEFVQPGETAILFYTKDQQSLTITIATASDSGLLIWLGVTQ